MKKNYFVLFCFLFVFIFIGCFQPVFYNIKKEVRLTSVTVPGIINSIVRYTHNGSEYLLTQNGKDVFYKPRDLQRTSENSVWNTRANSTFSSIMYDYLESNHNGEYIVNMAADSEYIYILTALIRADNSEGEAIVDSRKLYCTDSLTGSSWQVIDFPSISEKNSAIFCTNTLKKANRKAYFRNGKDLYELKGSNTPSSQSYKISGGAGSVPYSAVWFNGNVLFFGTLASTTNETLQGGDATMVYYGNNSRIYYSSDGSVFQSVSVSSGGTISCMTVTKDYLLFGQGENISGFSTGGGIYKVSLNSSGVPGSSIISFSTNADAVFTSSYQLITLLAVDPSKNETDNIIYASPNFKTGGGSISVSYDNLCLWAYYPSRGHWNRE